MDSIDAMIDRTLELDAKATSGPLVAKNLEETNGHRRLFWVCKDGPTEYKTVLEVDGDLEELDAIWKFADAKMFTEYRTLCPALARELRETRMMLARVESLLKDAPYTRHLPTIAEVVNSLRAWREAKEGKASE